VAVNPVTNRVYVARYGSASAVVLDGATNAVIATVAVGSAPLGIAVNPAATRAYVTNSAANSISVIRP
jgi:YVTN family beta-propeller protein